MHDVFRKNRTDIADATFLINHDMERLMDMVGFDEKKVRMASSLLLTYPGSPFIYYGEELGYRADRWLVWLPMLWDDPANDPGITSWMFDESVRKELISPPPQDALEEIKALPEQRADKNSLFTHYRTLIHLRNNSAALSSGELRSSDISNKQIVAFFRDHKSESLLVVHNLTSAEQKIDVTEQIQSYMKVKYSSSEDMVLDEDHIILPAYSTLVIGQ